MRTVFSTRQKYEFPMRDEDTDNRYAEKTYAKMIQNVSKCTVPWFVILNLINVAAELVPLGSPWFPMVPLP